jgi:hypothetical protein
VLGRHISIMELAGYPSSNSRRADLTKGDMLSHSTRARGPFSPARRRLDHDPNSVESGPGTSLRL